MQCLTVVPAVRSARVCFWCARRQESRSMNKNRRHALKRMIHIPLCRHRSRCNHTSLPLQALVHNPHLLLYNPPLCSPGNRRRVALSAPAVPRRAQELAPAADARSSKSFACKYRRIDREVSAAGAGSAGAAPPGAVASERRARSTVPSSLAPAARAGTVMRRT